MGNDKYRYMGTLQAVFDAVAADIPVPSPRTDVALQTDIQGASAAAPRVPRVTVCHGRGCPLSSSRYANTECSEGELVCPTCGSML